VVSREVAGRVLLGVGAVGAVVTLIAIVVGVRFLTQLDRSLEASLVVTARAVDTLTSSVELAGETVDAVEGTLRRTERTTRDLVTGLEDAGAVLDATADLTEQEIATSLEAVEDAMPALVQAAAVIDRTLSALSVIPFGPDYDPAEPFDDSLRAVQRELSGVPEALREQSELIRASRRSMDEVSAGTSAIADDLGELHRSLGSAADVLEEYAATAVEARDLVDESQADLGAQLDVARVLVVVLGVTFALGQAVPAGAGWLLLNPARAKAFLAGP
jgi:methyl-accepting chemotaxis protein